MLLTSESIRDWLARRLSSEGDDFLFGVWLAVGTDSEKASLLAGLLQVLKSSIVSLGDLEEDSMLFVFDSGEEEFSGASLHFEFLGEDVQLGLV
jgi:hypothetical protein